MKKDGGPAFPLQTTVASGQGGTIDLTRAQHMPMKTGMSLRQWYAGMAMMGMYSHGGGPRDEEAARYAFEVADAMIAEGEKE